MSVLRGVGRTHPRIDRPGHPARRPRPHRPVARLLRDGDRAQPGLRQHLRRERRARRLQRGVPDPRDRPRRAGRGRADRAVRADLQQPAPRDRRRRRRQRLRPDGPDRRGRGHGRRERPDLPRGAVAGRPDRGRLRPGHARAVRRDDADQLPRPGDVRGVDRARRGPRRQPPVRVLRAGADPVHDRHRRRRPCCSPAGSGSWRRPGAPSRAPSRISAIRAIGTLRTSFRIRPGVRGPDRGLRRVPAADGAADGVARRSTRSPSTWFTVLATGLGVGSVQRLNFASDYQVLPVSLIGVSFSLAVFPTLSAAFAADDGRSFRAELRPEPRRPSRS